MATETPAKPEKKSTPKKGQPEEEPTQEKDDDAAVDGSDDNDVDDVVSEVEETIEVFEPRTDVKRWCIGKPPEEGGQPEEYEFYEQRELGHIRRMEFQALVTRTIANALKEGGAVGLPFDDVLGSGGGSLRQRAAAIASQDIADATSFMATAFTLASYSPNFLLDCYCIWLDIPSVDRKWAKRVMAQNRNPEKDQWGLTDDMGFEMAERFIDQNYEAIRGFFAERLPSLVKRAIARERDVQKKKKGNKKENSEATAS
jgi:hypothetical protein